MICIVYVVETFYHIKLTSLVKYTTPFSSILLVHIHFFLYEILVYRGFYYIVTQACHSIPNEESAPSAFHNQHNTNNVKDCSLFLPR